MSKKINFLRAGALTMVLALGTTCFMSGTLAKYVTSGQGSDSARVAKFGVTITANGETFAQTYATHNEDVVGTIANSVVTSDNTDLVAPGTNGNMTSMTLTGTPEVAVEVAYEATFDLSENWVDQNGNYYCPLEITVGEKTIKGLDYKNITDFEAKVKEAIDGYKANYPANTNLSGVAVPAVSWAWPFSTSADNDVRDTFLGDQAAASNAATVQLTVKTTVTQID